MSSSGTVIQPEKTRHGLTGRHTGKKTQKSWLAGRGLQVVVAELIPVT